MTTLYISDKKCFICGATSKFPLGNLSLGNVGFRDLDGRPTQILRSSVYLWIQRCPSCGYCAPEIAQGDEADRPFLNSEAYRTQLNNALFPETANAFLCNALVMQNREHFADAAWSTVFAAWICDDNDYPESALYCRRQAIELFTTAIAKSIAYAESREQEQIYLIDLYRRCNDFTIAGELCSREIEKTPGDQVLDVLYFEKDLIERLDNNVHSISEIDDL